VLEFLSCFLGPSFEKLLSAKMKGNLKFAFMRLFQFVKLFVDPTRVTLFDYFVRASGIYCRENQKAVDSIIPFVLPLQGQQASEKNAGVARNAAINEGHTSGIFIQVRLRKQYETSASKDEWIEKLRTLKLFREIADSNVPSIALFLELGGDPLSMEPMTFEVVEHEFGCCIYVRTNRLSHIDPELAEADGAFQRRLGSLVDPSDSASIDKSLSHAIRRMFKTQPYGQTTRTK
jgi:hypothetical protein